MAIADRDETLINSYITKEHFKYEEMKNRYLRLLQDITAYYEHSPKGKSKEDEQRIVRAKIEFQDLGRYKAFFDFTSLEKEIITRCLLKLNKLGQKSPVFLDLLKDWYAKWETASFSVRGKIINGFQANYTPSYKMTLPTEKQSEYETYISYFCSVSPKINNIVNSQIIDQQETTRHQ